MKTVKKIFVQVEFSDNTIEQQTFAGELGLAYYKGIKYVPDENGVGCPTHTGKDIIMMIHAPGFIQSDIIEKTKDIIENIINR